MPSDDFDNHSLPHTYPGTIQLVCSVCRHHPNPGLRGYFSLCCCCVKTLRPVPSSHVTHTRSLPFFCPSFFPLTHLARSPSGITGDPRKDFATGHEQAVISRTAPRALADRRLIVPTDSRRGHVECNPPHLCPAPPPPPAAGFFGDRIFQRGIYTIEYCQDMGRGGVESRSAGK